MRPRDRCLVTTGTNMNGERERGADNRESFPRGAPKSETASASARALRIRYQEFFEFAPDCQLMTDSHGLIVQANHAAAALLDCRKEFLKDPAKYVAAANANQK